MGRERGFFWYLHVLICTVTLLASIGLFAVSLSQDCFYTAKPHGAPGNMSWGSGLEVLLKGWAGLLLGIPGWAANLPLAWTWVLIWFRPLKLAPLIMATVALALALSFLATTEMMINEAGTTVPVVGYGLGYWLWVGSCGASALGCFAAWAVNFARIGDEPSDDTMKTSISQY